MTATSVSKSYPVSADALWSLIGDFGNVQKWTGRGPESCISEGEGIGSLRTLNLADGRSIVDRLDAVGQRSYSYSIVTSPLPFNSYNATMAVAPIDAESCTFTWSGVFETIGMDEAQSIAFVQGIYQHGIAMIDAALER